MLVYKTHHYLLTSRLLPGRDRSRWCPVEPGYENSTSQSGVNILHNIRRNINVEQADTGAHPSLTVVGIQQLRPSRLFYTDTIDGRRDGASGAESTIHATDLCVGVPAGPAILLHSS